MLHNNKRVILNQNKSTDLYTQMLIILKKNILYIMLLAVLQTLLPKASYYYNFRWFIDFIASL